LSAVAHRTGPARQRAAAAWPPRAAPTARDKALSGRRRVPTALSRRSPAQPTEATRRRADCLARAARPPTASRVPPMPRQRHLARAARFLTAPSPLSEPTVAAPAVARRRARRRHAGEPTPPRHLRAPASPCRGRASAAHAGRAPCSRGPRALCDWAEREFGPVHPVKFY
jgi:hypothetical protein